LWLTIRDAGRAGRVGWWPVYRSGGLCDFDVRRNVIDDFEQSPGECLVGMEAKQAADFFGPELAHRRAESVLVRAVGDPAIAAGIFGAIQGVVGEGEAVVPLQQIGVDLRERVSYDAERQR